jgi:hypothetical protein
MSDAGTYTSLDDFGRDSCSRSGGEKSSSDGGELHRGYWEVGKLLGRRAREEASVAYV